MNWKNTWEEFADETTHWSYVRCLETGKRYEVICGHRLDGNIFTVVHSVIYTEDWNAVELNKLLKAFDYASLDAYIREMNFVSDKTDDGYYIDWMHLSSLIVETMQGREMSESRANELLEKWLNSPAIIVP